MKSIIKLSCAALLISTAGSFALANDAHHPAATASAEASTAMSEGEIRKIDKDAGKITIKHGPLANLDMPPMTMVFRVKDPAMLDQVKAGDKIRFVAEKVNGALTVTKLEARK
jgi:Cu(I)/Ag(I) efflux system periplasmic protein CusF